MGTFGPWVNCPYAPTTPTVYSTIISRFSCNFFPRMAPNFFGHHDSSSNLAESRYPRLYQAYTIADGLHSISRLFLKLFQRTRILPVGFTIFTK